MELENTNLCDITKVKIKNDFIEFIRKILYEIENEIGINRCIRDDNTQNAIYYLINKLFNKNKSYNIGYNNIYNYNTNIINSLNYIDSLKYLIDKLV